MKKLLSVLIALTVITTLGFALNKSKFIQTQTKEISSKAESSKSVEQTDNSIEILSDNLNIPWDLAFLPDNQILITERSGRLILLGNDKKIINVEGVTHIGEGGLLGMALHPDFNNNSLIYLYLTSSSDGKTVNRVERYKYNNHTLSERQVILEGILGSRNHDGGAIRFGPDKLLYITTGDAENPNLAQDSNSLNGKILRITDQGEIPADNPFGNAVYSLGHRNPQGLAWDDKGNLWETEHGRSGSESGYDEVNLIEKGANYGWPVIQGSEEKEDMKTPIIHSGKVNTWAPAGLEYLNGFLYFTGLRGESLYKAQIVDGKMALFERRLEKVYGRLRAVKVGPDGMLYITTSNKDGRGNPKNNDDKLLRINPSLTNTVLSKF
jgi:glucose/arabinose dehydrogenase